MADSCLLNTQKLSPSFAVFVAPQVEVRPELWGRYAAGLNRLQGCCSTLAPQHTAQQQQQQPAAVSGWSQGGGMLQLDDVQQLHQIVLQLLQQLEVCVTQRKAPTGGFSGGMAETSCDHSML
jgi:hypothetical protein